MKKNSGIPTLFKGGVVQLADTQSDREDADYDAFDELDERIARKRIKQSEEFIVEAERFI